MVEMSGSKAFVEGLKRENVDIMFGVTGGALLPICDELWGSDLRFVMARHEQGAAHMADGYARALGRVGVCLATSGPGATNLVTGIATANIDSSPVVAFTGQVPLSLVGTDAFQEVDIIGITASATKYNIQVRSPSEIPPAIKSAFHIASTGRHGAVLVDIPKDCQIDVEDIEFPDEVSFKGYKVNLEPNTREMDWAATLLSKARRPVIMAGGGVISSNASTCSWPPWSRASWGRDRSPATTPSLRGSAGCTAQVRPTSWSPTRTSSLWWGPVSRTGPRPASRISAGVPRSFTSTSTGARWIRTSRR
jgi:acetolactate synthase-1/2/3 large subunit